MKGGGFLALHLRGLCSSWASASFLYWERKDRDDEIANSYRISNGICMALSANFSLIFSPVSSRIESRKLWPFQARRLMNTSAFHFQGGV